MKELLEKVSKITRYKYEEGDLYAALEDMLDAYKYLEEEYNDLEEDLQDNYRPIPYAEQVGISNRDFI